MQVKITHWALKAKGKEKLKAVNYCEKTLTISYAFYYASHQAQYLPHTQ
jgi:hypothetical protein